MTLYSAKEVYSWRHGPTWLLFTFSAGFVNAAAFLACQRFVTHVTGTATRMGTELGRWTIVTEFMLVFACFVIGATIATLMVEGRKRRGREPWHRAPFVVVAVLLALVAFAGRAGYFGPFGATVDLPPDFVLLFLLSLAMGMQNAAASAATSNLVRTTHLTGPATNLGVSLAQLFYTSGREWDEASNAAFFRAGKVCAFVAGGAVAMVVCSRIRYLGFLLPAAVTLIAMSRSFSPAALRERAATMRPSTPPPPDARPSWVPARPSTTRDQLAFSEPVEAASTLLKSAGDNECLRSRQ